MPDHVHLLVSISPEYSVAQIVGFIKGKSGIHIARPYAGRRHNFRGQHLWTRGHFVSVMGDEATTRCYVREQETEDQRLDRLTLE